MNEEISKFWDELNKMYGLDLEMPKELEKDAENFKMNDVQYEMAMGKSFDAAMQSGMND